MIPSNCPAGMSRTISGFGRDQVTCQGHLSLTLLLLSWSSLLLLLFHLAVFKFDGNPTGFNGFARNLSRRRPPDNCREE